MKSDMRLHPSSDNGWLGALSALAACAALVVIGYAVVGLPDHALLVSNEASAGFQAYPTPGPIADTGSIRRAPAAHETRAVAPTERAARIDGHQQCASDQGIVYACVD